MAAVATIGVYGEACHRSLIAERLEREHGATVRHLRP